jgi:hypothetical protein
MLCRRIGTGGLCPACDEPVALADLHINSSDPEVTTHH